MARPISATPWPMLTDRGLSRSVQIAAASFINDPAAFAAGGDGQGFLEAARKNARIVGHARPATKL